MEEGEQQRKRKNTSVLQVLSSVIVQGVLSEIAECQSTRSKSMLINYKLQSRCHLRLQVSYRLKRRVKCHAWLHPCATSTCADTHMLTTFVLNTGDWAYTAAIWVDWSTLQFDEPEREARQCRRRPYLLGSFFDYNGSGTGCGGDRRQIHAATWKCKSNIPIIGGINGTCFFDCFSIEGAGLLGSKWRNKSASCFLLGRASVQSLYCCCGFSMFFCCQNCHIANGKIKQLDMNFHAVHRAKLKAWLLPSLNRFGEKFLTFFTEISGRFTGKEKPTILAAE